MSTYGLMNQVYFESYEFDVNVVHMLIALILIVSTNESESWNFNTVVSLQYYTQNYVSNYGLMNQVYFECYEFDVSVVDILIVLILIVSTNESE